MDDQHPSNRDPHLPPANELADRLGPFWSAAKVIDELGLQTHEALQQAADDGQVLLLPLSDGPLVAPIFQFAPTEDGIIVKPQVLEFLRTLSHLDPWTLGLLLTSEAEELGGKRPIDFNPPESSDALARFARTLTNELR